MKKKYTQEDIDQFFGNFKELPDYFELEKVHQLIDNPAAKATQPGNNYFKPYKFLIMTSAVITLVASMLLWPEEPSPKQEKDLAQTPLTSVTAEFKDKENNLSTVINVEEEIKQQEKENNQTLIPAKPSVGTAKERSATKKIAKPLPTIKPKTGNEPLTAKKENTWPADTVIDGSQLLITLTDEELEKLGFMLDETGIYYFNIFKGDTISFYSWHENGMGSMSSPSPQKDGRNKKNSATSFNFVPVTNSDPLFLHQKKYKSFTLADDRLAPVLIKGNQNKFKDDDIILWFTVTQEFFNSLPERYQHLQLIFDKVFELKKFQPNSDIIKYELKTVLDNMRFIELSEKELIPLGFKIKEEGIFYEIRTNAFAKVKLSLKKGGYSGVTVITELPEAETDKIMLSFLSDQYGIQTLTWSVPTDDRDKMKSTFLLDKSQLLVPIKIKKSSFPDILQEDQVFWYEPSEALFAALPARIGKQIRQEYNYLTAPNEEARRYLNSSCTFFEACKSTLKLNNFKLMPNPASYSTTISFEGLEESPGTISLVNLSGNVVKVLVADENFKKGSNTFQADLSGIGPGIYLVSINTDKGFKTQRLIITR